MDNRTPLSSLNATIAFVVTALIAAILLFSAFVLFLGELLGSHLLAMLIVGCGCAIAAWIIYAHSLRPLIKALEEQINTIYEVATITRKAINWMVDNLLSTIIKSLLGERS